MTFPVLASHSQSSSGEVSSHSITIPACAIGDLIVVCAAVDNRHSAAGTNIADFTRLAQQSEGGGTTYGSVFARTVDGSEGWYNGGAGGSATMSHGPGTALCVYVVLKVTGASGNVEVAGVGGNGGSADPPSLTPSWGAKDTKWLAIEAAQGAPIYSAPPSGYSHIDHGVQGTSFIGASLGVAAKDANATSDDPAVWNYAIATSWVGYTVAIEPVGAPPAPPVEGPPYVPPTPGAGIVEIWAAEPGAARWDVARWDEAVWSTAGWRDVTPESVDVEILWGSQRPELGILSKPEAGSWAIDIYDPDRILDPANAEGPYYGDLEPGLPVRLRHGELVVKQGIAESLGYQFSEEQGARDTAFLRVTDVISVLANASVPSDVTLADTLYARARDAIAAASLAVTVLPDPPAGDPVLAPWETQEGWSAWDWIRDAAEQVLWMPYVTNVGFLGFRDYRTPLDRGRVLGSPNLVGLQSIVQHNGLYSVVTALQTVADGDTVITRELTPKPRYGIRQFDRDGRTPDASDWAFAVLNDRARAGLRWVPGVLYPLTAADVDRFATIEAIETVGIYYPEADPAVIQEVIVVGGRITVVGKKDSEAVWTFAFEAAQTAQPALVTDPDGADLLVRDDDFTEFLYPDG